MFSMIVFFMKFNMSLMYDMADYVADVLDDRGTSWCPADNVNDVLGVCFAWNILGDYKCFIGCISKQYVLYVLYVLFVYRFEYPLPSIFRKNTYYN